MEKNIIESRLKKVRQRLEKSGLDAVIVTSWQNVFYLSGIVAGGFGSPMPLLIATSGEPTIVAGKGFADMLQDDFPYVQAKAYSGTVWQEVKETIEEWRLASKRIGVENKNISYRDMNELRNHLPQAEIVDFSTTLDEIRTVKSQEEVEYLRKACQITDAVYEVTMKEILKPGKSELQVAREMVCESIEKGGEERVFPLYTGAAFFPQVRFGIRTCYSNTVSTERKCQKGDVVLIDYGAVYRGYGADYTRAAVIGEPNEMQKKVFRSVYDVLEETLSIIKPGIKAKEIYDFSRDRLEKEGYHVPDVGHADGHGLGLGMAHRGGCTGHEGPYLNDHDETIMTPNIVLAVEPGIYLLRVKGANFGIRLEDNILVTEKGFENLSRFPKDLVMIS